MHGHTEQRRIEVSAVPAPMPVAAGRMWGHIDCPAARDRSGGLLTLPDGGLVPATCEGQADFLFETAISSRALAWGDHEGSLRTPSTRHV